MKKLGPVEMPTDDDLKHAVEGWTTNWCPVPYILDIARGSSLVPLNRT